MALRTDAENFLYREARLLDERRFEEWLALFTDDARYWLPIGDGEPDPDRRVSLIYDDVDRLRERIRRLRGEFAHAQEPASRVCRMIGNVEAEKQSGGEAEVRAVMTLVETRVGQQHVYAGHCRYVLRDGDDGGWRIALKQVSLVNSEHVIDNLTIIL